MLRSSLLLVAKRIISAIPKLLILLNKAALIRLILITLLTSGHQTRRVFNEVSRIRYLLLLVSLASLDPRAVILSKASIPNYLRRLEDLRGLFINDHILSRVD
jgi:hypothetical protein